MNPALKSRGGVVPVGTEHRRHRRYRLSIPVEVAYKEREGEGPPTRTESRDISARGIYFMLSPGAEVGTALEFDMVLPPQMCQGKSVRVHCRGRVARRDGPDEQGRVGIAAVIEEYEFIQTD